MLCNAVFEIALNVLDVFVQGLELLAILVETDNLLL
jgi:hypothetical protein